MLPKEKSVLNIVNSKSDVAFVSNVDYKTSSWFNLAPFLCSDSSIRTTFFETTFLFADLAFQVT